MRRIDFLEAVMNGVVNDDVKAYAKERYDKYIAQNNARISESAHIKAQITEWLAAAGRAAFRGEIAEAIEVSPNKVSAYCTQLVKDGVLAKESGLNPDTGKACVFYKIA